MPSRHVQLLTDHVANKIAAGEVVDRPASVVKELMENALDAGATRIEVVVVDGGKKLISILDDGYGMTRDDALLSIERHATSKISDVGDIEAIETMGFRGEALAAIASISRFTLRTRRQEDLSGHELSIYGGTLQGVEEVGGAPGTQITVRNLFFNVPARRKFLRADQTELSHIRQVFLLLALANPDVGLRLVVDEREVHQLPGGETLETRLRRLYSPDLVERLLPLNRTVEGVTVHGLIGERGLNRADRSDQYTFINRRPASAASIHAAVRDACKGLIPRDRHAVLFLFLDLDPGLVDVNVHPTKKEVRLRKPHQVHAAIVEAISEAFRLPVPESESISPDITATPPPEPQLTIEDLPEMPVLNYPRWASSNESGQPASKPFTPEPVEESPERTATSAVSGPWTWCRVLGQIAGRYVVMENEDGMVTMNPKAAYERVTYEKLLEAAEKGEIQSQGLLSAETVQLNPKDAGLLRAQLEVLQSMGMGISDFGGDCFMIDALPIGLDSVPAEKVVEEMVQELNAGSKKPAKDWLQDHLAMAAARAAVRGRTRFSIKEIETLVQQLATCAMPYTTPDGRPTIVLTRLNEWKRKFGDS